MSCTRRLAVVAGLTMFGVLGSVVDPVAARSLPASPAPTTGIYVVQPGDYLTGIANKLHINLADLLSLNTMTRSSVIHPGMQLIVPLGATNPTTPPPSSALVYTVVKGDSVSGIAAKLHVTLNQLLTANGLQKYSVIVTGQRLTVPAGGSLPTTSTSSSTTSSTSTSTTVQPAPAGGASGAVAKYTIVSGDSLIRIAVKLNVSLSALLSTNGITTATVIRPGMQLLVPAGGMLPVAKQVAPSSTAPSSTTAPVAGGQYYVVQSGDFLIGIAAKLGVPLADLLNANSMTRQSVIVPGKRLVVPAGGRLPVVASEPPTGTTTTTTPGSPTGNAKIDTVLAFASAQLGKPYRFNAAGPDAWDCSGLTMAAYAKIGVKLPHYSGAQATLGSKVDWKTETIRPGDLVFLESSPGSGIITHVGMAINATQWIQAPRTGDVVRISTMSVNRIVQVRRFVP